MRAPRRLLDDAALSPELRADLERTASQRPSYDAAVGLAGFQAAIAGSLAAPANSAAGGQAAHTAAQAKAAATMGHAAMGAKTAGLLGSAGVKAALAAAGTAAIVAATVVSWPARPVAPVESRSPARHVAAAPNAPAPATEVAQASPSAAEQTTEPAVAPTRSRDSAATTRTVVERSSSNGRTLRAVPAGTRAAAVADDALRREIAQLGRIKAMVESNPAAAYRMAQAGHREFSRGMLREEREALAVLSLSQIGRQAEARQRAQTFVARYPQSPLRERLQHLIDADTK
jgi:hypothetical protein